MEALLIGVAAAFNLLVVKLKFTKGRYEDAALDILALVFLSVLFGGTMGGMIIATIASAIISISLFFSPPTFTTSANTSTFIDEFKAKLPKR